MTVSCDRWDPADVAQHFRGRRLALFVFRGQDVVVDDKRDFIERARRILGGAPQTRLVRKFSTRDTAWLPQSLRAPKHFAATMGDRISRHSVASPVATR